MSFDPIFIHKNLKQMGISSRDVAEKIQREDEEELKAKKTNEEKLKQKEVVGVKKPITNKIFGESSLSYFSIFYSIR